MLHVKVSHVQGLCLVSTFLQQSHYLVPQCQETWFILNITWPKTCLYALKSLHDGLASPTFKVVRGSTISHSIIYGWTRSDDKRCQETETIHNWCHNGLNTQRLRSQVMKILRWHHDYSKDCSIRKNFPQENRNGVRLSVTNKIPGWKYVHKSVSQR